MKDRFFVKFFDGAPGGPIEKEDPRLRMEEVPKTQDPKEYAANAARLLLWPGVTRRSWASLYRLVEQKNGEAIESQLVFVVCFENSASSCVATKEEPT